MPAVAQPTFGLLCISIILQCVGGCNSKSQGGAAPVVTCQAEQRLQSLPTDVTTRLMQGRPRNRVGIQLLC